MAEDRIPSLKASTLHWDGKTCWEMPKTQTIGYPMRVMNPPEGLCEILVGLSENKGETGQATLRQT